MHKDLSPSVSWLEFDFDFCEIVCLNPAGVLCELAVVWLQDHNCIVGLNPAGVLCELAVVLVTSHKLSTLLTSP